jgi:hypothetical protein
LPIGIGHPSLDFSYLLVGQLHIIVRNRTVVHDGSRCGLLHVLWQSAQYLYRVID